jgi:hypothetical protein
MSSNDLSATMLEAAGLLGARLRDSSASTCQLEMNGMQIRLTVLEGPSGGYIAGSMELAPLVVEESGKEILYAMYLNGTMHESFGFPLWFGMDAEENRLLACFSLSTIELTASALAAALKPLEELNSLDVPG